MVETVLFFGAWNKDSGHYLYDYTGYSYVNNESICRRVSDFPVPIQTLDGGLIPPREFNSRHGKVFMSYVNGWTFVTFNDDSVDTRPGSVSVYLARGKHSFEDMVELIKKWYPRIWDRYEFKISRD